MTTTPATPMDDVLYAFAAAKAVPDADPLDEFVRQYPEYADALTEFAIELVLDAATLDEIELDDDDETVSPAVARAISHFHNTAYELEKSGPAKRAAAHAVNPIASLDRTRFRALANALHANNTFIIKLRDRTIDPESIISRMGFCEAVAKEIAEPLDCIIAHFRAEQTQRAISQSRTKAGSHKTRGIRGSC